MASVARLPVVTAVVSPRIVMVVIIVVGEGIADKPGRGDSGDGESGIDRLHWAAHTIVGGHATHSSGGNHRNGGPTENRSGFLHIRINEPANALFKGSCDYFRIARRSTACGAGG